MNELDFVFWYWWVWALLLLVIELVAPGFFFLWMSAAGFVTGCLVFLFPDTPENLQIIEFSILSICAIGAWRSFSTMPENSPRTFTMSEMFTQNISGVRPFRSKRDSSADGRTAM